MIVNGDKEVVIMMIGVVMVVVSGTGKLMFVVLLVEIMVDGEDDGDDCKW